MASLIFNLDNSAFSLLSCSRRFQLRVIHGKTLPRGLAPAFGDAVHKGLEYLDKGMEVDEMVSHLQKVCSGVDLPKVLSIIRFFKLQVKLEPPLILPNKNPAIELKFRYKYTSVLLPGSHEHLDIYLVGTIDRVHITKEGILVITDYKTTQAATADAIKKTMSTYSLAFQLPFYLYALKNFGILPADVVDYIMTNNYRLEIILITANTVPFEFKRSIRPAFPTDFIDKEVPLVINSMINRAVQVATMPGAAPKEGMTVYKACDNCEYRNACLVSGTNEEEEILSRFDTIVYDPLSWR